MAAMTPLPADPIAAVVHPDPYPYYAELTATGGGGWYDDLGLWVVASAPDVNEVLDDPDCRVRPVAEPVPLALVGTPAGDLFARLARTTEGDGHQQARAVAERALMVFPPTAIRQAVARQAAALSATITLDRFVSTIAVRVVAELLGVARPGIDAVCEHTMALVRGFRPTATADDVDAASVAGTALRTRFDEANVIGLLIQSAEATAALIGNSVVAMIGDRSRLESAATLTGSLELVERTLRHDPPVHNTRRFVAVDHVVAGRSMRTGDQILVVLAAADPAATFGRGRHACPGSSVALTVAAATVACLAGDGGALVAGAAVGGYRPSVNVRTPRFVAATAFSS
jgi:cytochrome P450